MATEAFRIDGPLITGIDEAGDPLAGGKLYLFEPGTTTPKGSWKDEAKTDANTHPIILDSAGRARAYIDGQYAVRMDSADDVQVWTQAVISDPTVSVNINNGGAPGDDITSPLVTKGDLLTRDDNEPVRYPLTGVDNAVLVEDSSTPTGWATKLLEQIPGGGGGGIEEPPADDVAYARQTDSGTNESIWVPGGSGSGIAVPIDVPVPVGGIVTYDDTAGTQAQGNPSVAILGQHKMVSVDVTVFEIEALLGGGTTLHITPGDGGASLSEEVPAGADAVNNPVVISSTAALDVRCDGPLTLNGVWWDLKAPMVAGNGFLKAIAEDHVVLGDTATGADPEGIVTGYVG